MMKGQYFCELSKQLAIIIVFIKSKNKDGNDVTVQHFRILLLMNFTRSKHKTC